MGHLRAEARQWPKTEDAAYEKCKQMDLRRSRVRGTSVLGSGVRVERTVRADRRRVPPLDTAQLSLTFTIVMSFFCLGGLTCGALSARISPRIFLWISALLFLAGFLLTAGMRSLPMLYVGFGVVCGLASGFSYNAVLGTVGAWFPDKQGLVSGILLMGFGLSSFLIGKLSFTEQALERELQGCCRRIKRLKPSTVKGRYVTKRPSPPR